MLTQKNIFLSKKSMSKMVLYKIEIKKQMIINRRMLILFCFQKTTVMYRNGTWNEFAQISITQLILDYRLCNQDGVRNQFPTQNKQTAPLLSANLENKGRLSTKLRVLCLQQAWQNDWVCRLCLHYDLLNSTTDTQFNVRIYYHNTWD